MKKLLLALVLSGCGAVGAPNFSGDWRYSWEVRPDVWWHGTLSLEDQGGKLSGALGYPDEDPAAQYDCPSLRSEWNWPVTGSAGYAADLRGVAPAPYESGWRFIVWPNLEGESYSGPCCDAAAYEPQGGFKLAEVTP